MHLLREKIESVGFKKKEGRYYIEAPFIQAGVVNGNNRIYRYDFIKPEIDRYINEKISKNRAIGELNHPTSPEINPKEASHLITSLQEEVVDHGRGIVNWNGKAKILSTPNGKIVSALLEDGVVLGVSTRALGSTKAISGINEVQNDFILCTAADIVYDPSAPDAFARGILENKEWVVAGQGKNRELFVETWKKELHKDSAKVSQYKLLANFQKFLTVLWWILFHINR